MWKNYKGTKSEICIECTELDDENHRLNYCTKYRDINYCDHTPGIDFRNINGLALKKIVVGIKKLWNVYNGNGTMYAE